MITLLALSSNGLLMSSRVPQPLMLLGADGLPMKKAGNAPEKKIEVAGESSASGGAAFDKSLLVDSAKDEFSSGLASGVAPNIAIAGESEPAERKGAFTRDELPEDLKDFDPTFDPLAAPRPPLDFCAASGRPTECVFGAVAPESSEKMADWSTYIRDQGITRILGLFSAEDASARASDGTPQGFFADLQNAGFEAANIGLLDPRVDGARDAAMTMLTGAVAAKERLVVCCADGNKLTAVILADWLLTDYIGGENYEEACHALAMRKRLAGVERLADPEELERWMTTGKL